MAGHIHASHLGLLAGSDTEKNIHLLGLWMFLFFFTDRRMVIAVFFHELLDVLQRPL